MKTAHYLAIAIVSLLFGCSKENTPESEFMMLKNAKLPIPMQFDFSAIPDISVPFTACVPIEGKVTLPGKQWLNGTTSYFGEIDQIKSYVLNANCELTDSKTIKESFDGQITTASGDNFKFTGWIQIDISKAISNLSAPVVGEISVNGGTGIFAGVSGSVTISGTADYSNGNVDWTGTGSLIYN